MNAPRLPERNDALERSLHPEFLQHLPQLLEIISMALDLQPEPEQLLAYISEDEEWNQAWTWATTIVTTNRISCLGGNAYGVPFLHPAVCAKLVDRAEQLAGPDGWQPAADEELPYQIPELVVAEHDPRLHAILANLAKYLDVWHLILYQAVPQSVSRIQFTKYTPEATAHGNWHHDRDSDYTAVVSLNPDNFTGGGTDLKVTPTRSDAVQPLPAGYAMLLNGRQLQHRGRRVESGARHLLTFWLDSHPVA